MSRRDGPLSRDVRAPTIAPRYHALRGRIAVVEVYEPQGLILKPAGYDKAHEQDRKSHRGRVVAMGAPALTRKGRRPIEQGFRTGMMVHYVFAKLSDHDGGHGSYSEEARLGVWPPTGEEVTWIAQEEVIAVEWGDT